MFQIFLLSTGTNVQRNKLWWKEKDGFKKFNNVITFNFSILSHLSQRKDLVKITVYIKKIISHSTIQNNNWNKVCRTSNNKKNNE